MGSRHNGITSLYSRSILVAASGIFIAAVSHADTPVQKRQPFNVPLPIITTLFDGDKQFAEAFVTFGGSSEGWAIGPVDDRYVKDTRRERVDHFFR